MELSHIIKEARESKDLLMRELAAKIEIDIATVSKFEKGDRNPTRPQILKLSEVLELDVNTLLTLWLRDKILNEVNGEENALKALKMAQNRVKNNDKLSS